MSLWKKAIKFLKIIRHRDYRAALWYSVTAAIEHERVLKMLSCKTVVDIGANSGQFALVARHCSPETNIISFEPLPKPCEKFRALFSNDKRVILHPVAIGNKSGEAIIHISCQDDSSSLLPITPLQSTLFPGTEERETQKIEVKPLDEMITSDEITTPALLKLDVQGYELQALKGCVKLLDRFDYVYVECSFVELYAGQSFAYDVVDFLDEYGFRLKGVYNAKYDPNGQAIQSEFLFEHKTKDVQH